MRIQPALARLRRLQEQRVILVQRAGVLYARLVGLHAQIGVVTRQRFEDELSEYRSIVATLEAQKLSQTDALEDITVGSPFIGSMHSI